MKIGVVGCGNVGSASAYACVMSGVGTEMVLVDKNPALAHAQADDISHATPFAKFMPVTAGDYSTLENAGIVMVAAGVNQKPGESRLDLLKRNADIFADIIPKIVNAAPGAILLIATNPADIMTHLAASFVPDSAQSGRVIGSGTILDTARFRTLLARQLGVSSHSVYAHVLGEHGDSEVLHWSGVSIGNFSLGDFGNQIGWPLTEEIKLKIDEGVRRAAYSIIKGKGATWYGIGAGMARLAKAIAEDEHSILTCCSPISEIEGIDNVTLSLPHIISSKGIEKILWPKLDANEALALKLSAHTLRHAMQAIGL